MSTFQRIVPVKLIAGKEYVLRNGRHVYVKDNPHWQCAAKFPFFVMQGPDFIVYFTPEGQADPAGGENEYDIIRPVYKKGETYIDRNGVRRVINLDDGDTTFPLEDEDRYQSYTRDGRMYTDEDERGDDLMDYEQPPSVCQLMFAPPPAPVADSWVGKRVHFTEDGQSGTGLVLWEFLHTAGRYEVRADSPFAGHGTGGLKWHVWGQNMRLADANTGITDVPSIVHDVSPDLPILATPVTLSRVGMRVEVQLDCATTGFGVITYEDKDGTSVVEFDEGTEWVGGLHTCAGHAPSGRGWWCHNDTIRAVSEAETQVEAERSEAEALNEVDVAEVWAAYRINPSIDIDSWIAARRKLKAAAK